MTGKELKEKFIGFFESKGHTKIKNSSVIPENDPSALFINSGMHPLVPYLLGENHPSGTRLTNYQRAIRTGDIDQIGISHRHLTFMEMLGEWSLGDYGKKETLEWSMEFLVEVLGFDPKRLYATVFRGNDIVPRDEEAIEIWKEVFKKYGIETSVGERFNDDGNSERIIALGEDDNFWKVGDVGPCGPCSEIYYDRGLGETSDDRYLEIGNNVFMFLNKTKEGNIEELKRKNIDVGWGFDRLLCIVQNILPNGDLPLNASNFDTDSFMSQRDWLIEYFKLTLDDYYNNGDFRRAVRIILDHIRASVVMIADGVTPSNKDQGYVLRRLLRRAVTFGRKYSEDSSYLNTIATQFIENLGEELDYIHFKEKKDQILQTIKDEIFKFETVLKNGIKELSKIKEDTISGETAFRLKEALGLPLEITEEIAKNHGKSVDVEKYHELMEEHQNKSRMGGEKKFVGGLGDHSDESIRYHTCAHLFLAAARKVLGDSVHQKGQNITPERLRYDISYDKPISKEDLEKIEETVNNNINRNLDVDFIEVPLNEAKQMGAEGVFDEKYANLDKVKIYRIYDFKLDESNSEKYVSKEFCGGPHVKNTSEIKQFGKFKILKEESSSGGVRRVKAILTKE